MVFGLKTLANAIAHPVAAVGNVAKTLGSDVSKTAKALAHPVQSVKNLVTHPVSSVKSIIHTAGPLAGLGAAAYLGPEELAARAAKAGGSLISRGAGLLRGNADKEAAAIKSGSKAIAKEYGNIAKTPYLQQGAKAMQFGKTKFTGNSLPLEFAHRGLR